MTCLANVTKRDVCAEPPGGGGYRRSTGRTTFGKVTGGRRLRSKNESKGANAV